MSDRDVLIPPHLEAGHFDVFLLHAKSDAERIDLFRLKLHQIRLSPRNQVTSCTLEDIRWLNNEVDSFDEAVNRSTYIFLMLTRNFKHDCWAKLQTNEAIMRAIQDKHNCLIPVMMDKDSFTPPCTRSIKPIEVYNDTKRPYLPGLKKLLECRQKFKLEREKKQAEELTAFRENALHNPQNNYSENNTATMSQGDVNSVPLQRQSSNPNQMSRNINYNITISGCENILVGENGQLNITKTYNREDSTSADVDQTTYVRAGAANKENTFLQEETVQVPNPHGDAAQTGSQQDNDIQRQEEHAPISSLREDGVQMTPGEGLTDDQKEANGGSMISTVSIDGPLKPSVEPSNGNWLPADLDQTCVKQAYQPEPAIPANNVKNGDHLDLTSAEYPTLPAGCEQTLVKQAYQTEPANAASNVKNGDHFDLTSAEYPALPAAWEQTSVKQVHRTEPDTASTVQNTDQAEASSVVFPMLADDETALQMKQDDKIEFKQNHDQLMDQCDMSPVDDSVIVEEQVSMLTLHSKGSDDLVKKKDSEHIAQPSNSTMCFSLDDSKSPRVEFPLSEASKCIGVELDQCFIPTSKSTPSLAEGCVNGFNTFKKTALRKNKSNVGLNSLLPESTEPGVVMK